MTKEEAIVSLHCARTCAAADILSMQFENDVAIREGLSIVHNREDFHRIVEVYGITPEQVRLTLENAK